MIPTLIASNFGSAQNPTTRPELNICKPKHKCYLRAGFEGAAKNFNSIFIHKIISETAIDAILNLLYYI